MSKLISISKASGLLGIDCKTDPFRIRGKESVE